MHFSSDQTISQAKLWTREDLRFWLRKRFKTNDLLLPDDNFYPQHANKTEILKLSKVLQKRFKLKNQVHITFDSTVKYPGHTEVTKHKVTLTLPKRSLSQPLQAAASLAHLLAHAAIITNDRTHIDDIENERLIDEACVEAGLGIVVLNGAVDGNWKTFLRAPKQSGVIGFYDIRPFARRVETFANQRNVDTKQLLKHSPKWMHQYFSVKTKPPYQNTARIIQNANQAYKKSAKTALLLATFFTVLAISSVLVIRYTPLGFRLDSKLTELRTSAETLQAAHTQCQANYLRLEESLPKDRISSDRLLSYEQNRCQSLANRYNAATRSYNNYLRERRR